MANAKLRQAIALEAARLMYERVESEYFTAKRKAAKRLCRGGVKPEDLPSNAEIRDQIQVFARIHEGDRRTEHLRDMRLDALRLMRLLRPFRPRLIGSVMTGHVRKGSDIDIHVFSDSVGLVTDLLEQEGYQFDVERKQVVKHGESRIFTHIHVHDRFNFELTVYAEDKAHYVFKSSITGKAIERASIRELEELLEREYPGLNLEGELEAQRGGGRSVPDLPHAALAAGEGASGRPKYHPEGDVLYHSLQVFELARDAGPTTRSSCWRRCCTTSARGSTAPTTSRPALAALDGLMTERTRFFIEHHMDAHDYRSRHARAPAEARAGGVARLRGPDAAARSSTTPAASPARRSAPWTRRSIT